MFWTTQRHLTELKLKHIWINLHLQTNEANPSVLQAHLWSVACSTPSSLGLIFDSHWWTDTKVSPLCLSPLRRWMPPCHLAALPCETGGATTAPLMSRISTKLDRSFVREYHKNSCMQLFFDSLPLPWIRGHVLVFPNALYTLHELFSNWIAACFPANLAQYIVHCIFAAAMKGGDSVSLLLTTHRPGGDLFSHFPNYFIV